MKLLVDSDEFWNCLKADISKAKSNIFIQAMSFEGDTVGQDLGTLVIHSKASDKRILVDSYSKHVINDQFLCNPFSLFNRPLRSEVRATDLLFKTLKQNNVGVKFTNPMGLMFRKYPHRNHKKLIVIDHQICYLGGFNFCEHNFAWHDMMVRLENNEVARFFAEDFENTWNGNNLSLKKTIDSQQFILFDGVESADLHQEIFDIIGNAKKTIWVISPYITHKYLEELINTANRGIDVNLISPEKNNKPLLKHYVLHKLAGTPVKFHLYQGRMSHLKAILVDERTLIMGSSNFDFVSYLLEQEIIAILNNQDLVADFKKRILLPDIVNSQQMKIPSSTMKGFLSDLLLKIAYFACKIAS